MATDAMHVTLAGDRAGDYLIEQELPDGRLLLRPDPAYPSSTPVFHGRAATIAEFNSILGALPTSNGSASAGTALADFLLTPKT